MLTIIKDNPVSYGKDPNALAVATLYTACLKEGEKVCQLQIAMAGDTSIVTLKKRFQDVRNLFLYNFNSLIKSIRTIDPFEAYTTYAKRSHTYR